MKMTLTARTVWPIVVLLVLAAGIVSGLRWRAHISKVIVNNKVIVNIGPYPSLRVEQQAALQRLSLELRRHPEATAVRIVAGTSAWREGVMGYVRTSPSERVFWYDDRYSTPRFGYVDGNFQGISAEVLVSEEPIHEAARRNVSVSDVDHFNHLLRIQLGLDRPTMSIAVKPVTTPSTYHRL